MLIGREVKGDVHGVPDGLAGGTDEVLLGRLCRECVFVVIPWEGD